VAGVFSNAVSQGNIIADTMIVAAAGGVAAELTGGKFANGALTAAFANLYNKYRGDGLLNKSKAIPITAEQRALADSGNVEAFWRSRLADGDPIASIALGSIGAGDNWYDNLLGAIVNNRLQAFAKHYLGHEIDINAVRVAVMRAHVMAVGADVGRGVTGLLHPEQVAEYHHKTFAGIGLPPTTFGGTPYRGAVGEANYTSFIWCGGCDWR
jgi:hypothetical protein